MLECFLKALWTVVNIFSDPSREILLESTDFSHEVSADEAKTQGLAQEGANGLENHGNSKTCVTLAGANDSV